jgi:hypothetical protein
VADGERATEVAWLRESVYLRNDASPKLERIDPKRRFVERG